MPTGSELTGLELETKVAMGVDENDLVWLLLRPTKEELNEKLRVAKGWADYVGDCFGIF